MRKITSLMSILLYAVSFGLLVASATSSPSTGIVCAALSMFAGLVVKLPKGSFATGATTEEDETETLVKSIKENVALITKKFDEKADATEIEKLKFQLDQLEKQHAEKLSAKQTAEIDELKAILVKQGEELTKLKTGAPNGSKEVSLHIELKDNKEALQNILKSGVGEIELKANVLRASIATNPSQLIIDGIGQLQRMKRGLYNFIRKIPVGKGNHNGTIAYIDWDEATTVKAAAMVAEGAAFPESTATFKGYTLPLRKIGDTLPVSEEFFEDQEMAAGELELFLDANVNAKIDDEIINGDNTGQRLKGIFTTVPAFTAVASGIAQANIFDLIVKVAESITSVGGAKYQPDFVAMNIVDINKLVLKKDTNGQYLFSKNLQEVPYTIIEDNNVAANTMVLGDSRFARIYEMGGVVLSKGEVNAQFTSDMMTLKARKRLAFLIRQVDTTGFRKVASISSSLTTLAS
jgi:HK97 family phage major capsid protein